MPFTLLHTADLHLGKSFSQWLPERAGQRRADLLATLGRVCRTARDRRVDLLVIAGDLFDRATVTPALLAGARRALAEAGVPVLITSGNHDPLDGDSPYLAEGWPAQVTIVRKAGWQRVPFPGIELWAFGYARGEAHRNLWSDFPGCSPEALLVAHAACLAPGLAAEAGYFPFTPADVPPCAYLALGHHHRSAQVAPCAWYAGSPEPLEAEISPACALLVTLHGANATVEPLDVATRRHRTLTLSVSGRSAAEIWDEALAVASIDHLLTLRLTGMLAATESLDVAALRAELSARSFAVELLTDDLLLPLDDSAGEGVLGALQALGRARLAALPPESAERAQVARAVRYAALALEGKL